MGAAYRSHVKHTLAGDANFNRSTGLDTLLTGAGSTLLTDTHLKADLSLPEIVSLARLSELAGPETEGAAGKLWLAESAYYGVDILKAAIGLGVAGWLIFNPKERLRHSGKNVDVIDKADHRHVDR